MLEAIIVLLGAVVIMLIMIHTKLCDIDRNQLLIAQRQEQQLLPPEPEYPKRDDRDMWDEE